MMIMDGMRVRNRSSLNVGRIDSDSERERERDIGRESNVLAALHTSFPTFKLQSCKSLGCSQFA